MRGKTNVANLELNSNQKAHTHTHTHSLSRPWQTWINYLRIWNRKPSWRWQTSQTHFEFRTSRQLIRSEFQVGRFRGWDRQWGKKKTPKPRQRSSNPITRGTLTHSLKLQTVTNSNMTNDLRKAKHSSYKLLKHHNLKSSQDREACLVGDNRFRWHRCGKFSLACMMWKAYEGLWQVNGLSILPPQNIFKFSLHPRQNVKKESNAIRPRFECELIECGFECGLSAAVDTEKGFSQTDTWRTVRLPSVVVAGPLVPQPLPLRVAESCSRPEEAPPRHLPTHSFSTTWLYPLWRGRLRDPRPLFTYRDRAPWFRVARRIPPLVCLVMDSWARKCFKGGFGNGISISIKWLNGFNNQCQQWVS